MTLEYPITTNALGRRLRAARSLAGLEQVELAALIGSVRNTVSNWELGKSEPSATMFVRIARVCGVDLDWLAEGVNTETAPAVAGAAFARPEGLEPPTFCSVVSVTDSTVAFLLGLIGALGVVSRRI